MNATTMTLTKKRQTVFPIHWCKKAGLAKGGPVNVFELPNGYLLIRPVHAPNAADLEQLFAAPAAGKQTPGQIATIVNRALRSVRSSTGRR